MIGNIYQTFLIVSNGLWPQFQPQISSTEFVINILFIIVKTERKVRLFVWNYLIFSSLNTHLFDLKFVVFFQKFFWDSYIEFQQRIILGNFFKKFWPFGAILFPIFLNLASVSTIFSKLILRWKFPKKFIQVLSYVFLHQLRRHVKRQNT